jgi:ABC-type cobalamin/Fe3+-siderophores transport system ATPase subunit
MPKRRVISDFTLTFFRDQVTVIIGHKGSGKSTLLKLLAGHNNVYPDLDGPMFMAYGIDIIHQRE